VTDIPRESADNKAGETDLGAGNSKLVTTLPPVKTKVCLHQIRITGSRVVDPWHFGKDPDPRIRTTE
jgi:hypothetical protein